MAGPAIDDRNPPPVPRAAWLLLAFLTSLNVLNFVVRQLLPSLAPLLIRDLGLSRAQIGALVGFTFVVVYSIVGVALGVVADRWPRRLLIAGGLATWSVMTLVSGLARSFSHLAWPRVLTGVGQAALTPAALAMLAEVFPSRRLGLASGVYYAGLPIGTALSLGLAGWMAPRFGWRACFYVVGAVGLAAVALLPLVRDPRHGARAGRRPTFAALAGDLRQVLREQPALVLLMLGGSTLTYVSAAATHGVTWLVEERAFGFATAASLSGLMVVASGLVGNLAGGWFSDWCRRRWRGGRAWSLVVLTLFFAPFSVAFYTAAPRSALFFVAWFFSSASTVAYFGPLFSAVQERSPARARSTLVAFTLLVINIAGVGPGSLVTGWVGDRASLTAGLLISVAVSVAGTLLFAVVARASVRAPSPS